MTGGGDAHVRTHPPCSRGDAEEVVRRLREAGHVAYFAGGCVRDLLMGLEAKDFDVATDAPPRRVRQLFSNTQAVGAAFGVILVRLGGSQIEVATFRSEGRYLDGRRPEAVEFTDAAHDAQRRDFTINGLFLDPFSGEVIDYVGGREDLAARRLRAIGVADERFEEDHLRLMRAVRFGSRFDLSIEAGTAEAMRRHAPKIVRISPERIADELRRMLTPVTRGRAWPMLWRFALVDQLFRFLPVEAGHAEFEPGKSVFLTVAPGETITFALALAAASLDYVLQATGERDVRRVLEVTRVQQIGQALRQSLRISNDELDDVTGTLSSVAPLLLAEEPTVAVMKRFLAKGVSPGGWALVKGVEEVIGTGGREGWLRGRLEKLASGEVAPVPLITGDDLTAVGMKPGPVFRLVLEAVYDAQLEGRVGTRGEAMEMAAVIAKG